MKSVQLAVVFAGLSFAAAAFAVPSSAPVQPVAPAPVPSLVVSPTGLPRSLAGSTVQVEFKLDAAGRPQDVRLPSVYDPQVARQLKAAFSQWKFTPSPLDAKAQQTRFVLPLELKP